MKHELEEMYQKVMVGQEEIILFPTREQADAFANRWYKYLSRRRKKQKPTVRMGIVRDWGGLRCTLRVSKERSQQ